MTFKELWNMAFYSDYTMKSEENETEIILTIDYDNGLIMAYYFDKNGEYKEEKQVKELIFDWGGKINPLLFFYPFN